MTAPGIADFNPARARALKVFFCGWVLALAIYQFAENTADPDLFGHIAFGQQMLRDRVVGKTELYSWTASGQPFLNHEFLADVMLGGVHLLLGGSGILGLKVAIGMLTLWLCLRLGGAGLVWPCRAFAWGFGALAVVEISFGFAPRPQIFTALSLAIELWILRRIHAGAERWALALPGLFVFWINTHGGALAGAGLLGLATAVTTAQYLVERRQRIPAGGIHPPATRIQDVHRLATDDEAGSTIGPRTVVALWLACLGVGAAMLCNPWGIDMLRWLVGSVLWLRPEIEEWNPPPLNADHAAFFILLGAAAVGWALTRKRRAAWELAACLAFAVLAVRSVRNTPLCSIVILALVPPHFASAAARLEAHLARSLAFFRRAGSQRALAGLFGLAILGSGSATFVLHKEHPLTIEVSRGLYPVSALEFIRQHDLRGNLLVFFDWGDLCIWQLPSCRVSIDGRLDACYSRELIAEHWKLYNGQTVNSHRLDLDQADLALLPANFAGAFALAKRPGWQPVYYDDLAVVLVRGVDRFAKLRQSGLPVQGPSSATLGAEPLPGANSPRSQR